MRWPRDALSQWPDHCRFAPKPRRVPRINSIADRQLVAMSERLPTYRLVGMVRFFQERMNGTAFGIGRTRRAAAPIEHGAAVAGRVRPVPAKRAFAAPASTICVRRRRGDQGGVFPSFCQQGGAGRGHCGLLGRTPAACLPPRPITSLLTPDPLRSLVFPISGAALVQGPPEAFTCAAARWCRKCTS